MRQRLKSLPQHYLFTYLLKADKVLIFADITAIVDGPSLRRMTEQAEVDGDNMVNQISARQQACNSQRQHCWPAIQDHFCLYLHC